MKIYNVLLLVFLLLFTINSFSQITHYQILKNDSLKYKTVQIEVGYDTGYAIHGSAFILSYNGNYYLTSNYHMLCGRLPVDTCIFVTSVPKEFSLMFAILYSLNKKGYEYVTFNLHNAAQNRTYLSLPANKKTLIEEADVAFKKLDNLPLKVVIAPIKFENNETQLKLKPNTLLYCFGYSKSTANYLYPYCDTLITVGDSTFTSSDNYVLVNNPGDMHGSSGSPVFYKTGEHFHFLGIYSETIPPISLPKMPRHFSP